MKKILIFTIILITLVAPVFSDQKPDAADSDPGFGLQSDIFKYVLTSSNNMLSTSNGFPTNFKELNEYPLTPGDIFTLLINYGANTERSADYITTYNIQLQPDYSLMLPFIGRTSVKGKNISEMQEMISKKIAEMMPVQFVSFNLTTPANFNVFIYGGVNVSGYINATPVTTVIDAIALCKGFKTNASYRDVRLLRGEETISVDISKFYANADFDSNPKLQPGDKLYIPMAEKVVSVTGMIHYPGVYELLPGENLDTLLKLAGALKPGARENKIEIARMDRGGKTAVIETLFSNAESFELANGDVVSIPSISENAASITIEGAVYGNAIPGTSAFTAPTKAVKLEIPYYPGITLLKVMDKVGGPTPYAILEQAQIRRPDEGEFISLDVENLWETRKSSYDVELNPGDHILIPIERTSVAVFGEINGSSQASAIPHVNSYTVMDYIVAAGGINTITADPNNIVLITREGEQIKVSFTDEVPPGSVINVNKNTLYSTNDVFNNIFLVTGWATVIITFINLVFDLNDNLGLW